MRQLVKIFKALSDPNRLRIMKMLEVRSLCVCEITEILGLSASTVSKHLSILRDVDLILDHKEGKWVNYSLNSSVSDPLARQFLEILKTGVSDTLFQQDAEKVRSVDRYSICSI